MRSSDRGKWQAMRPIGRQEREAESQREIVTHGGTVRGRNPKVKADEAYLGA